MSASEAPEPLDVGPSPRRVVDVALGRMRTLARQRFPESAPALEPFFAEALRLARDAWPDPPPPTPEEDAAASEAEPDEDADAEWEPEEAGDPAAAQQALLLHLEQLEDLLEALTKQ